MLLAFAPQGTQLRITSIEGGVELRHRLKELGLVDSARFELLQADGNGPVMIRLGGSKIAIGRGMAHKIEVEPAD